MINTFAVVLEALGDQQGVSRGRMFGSDGLRFGGKVFAMEVKGRLVVKLPAERVDELVAAGAERFDPGHGRLMRQWASVSEAGTGDWLAREVREALATTLRAWGRSGYQATMQLHDPAAPVFAALGDPTRLQLLTRLGRGAASLTTLAAGTVMTRQAVTKHLEVLARAGLVHDARHGRERRFSANAAPLAEASDWIAAWRAQWESSFDRLADYLDNLPKEDQE